MAVNFLLYLLAVVCFVLYMYQKREIYRKLGFSFLGLGFLYFSITITAVIFGVEEESTKLSVLIVFSNILVGTYYFLLVKFKKWNLKEFAPLIATVAFLFSLLGLEVGNNITVLDKLLLLHLGVVLTTFAVLVLSSTFSLLKLIVEKKLKSGEFNLPFGLPATLIFKLEKRLFVIGFLLLTFVLIFNFLWAKVKMKTLIWDSRTVSTVLMWLYYWTLFHGERFGLAFFRKNFAVLNIAGAVLLVFVLIFTHHKF